MGFEPTEPIVSRPDGFQDRCNKPDSATLPELVPEAGLEPARLSARGFKPLVSTYSTTQASALISQGIHILYFKQRPFSRLNKSDFLSSSALFSVCNTATRVHVLINLS